MQKEGKRRLLLIFESLIVISWLSAMALGGFFLPGFLSSIPTFKIKELQIHGAYTVPPSVISSSVHQVSKNNGLFVDSKRILAKINELTDNSVKDIRIERSFSLDGMNVHIYVHERSPIAYVAHDDTIMMIDNQGELFYNPNIEKKLPIIYTFSFDYIKKHSIKVNELVEFIKEMGLSINEIYVTDRNTFIYVSGSRVVLPPLSQMSPSAFDKMKKLYNKIGMERMDILITENMAVIKEDK